MSWYRDPQLFIYAYDKTSFFVYRIRKEFSSRPILATDYNYQGLLSFSEHLSLGNNKDSDYDSFKATFPYSAGISYKFINSQGLVVDWDQAKQTGSWSREDINSPFWSLPGITRQKTAAEEALEGKLSNLEAEISSLRDEAKERDDKILSLEKQVSNLTSELVQCCGGGAGGGSSVDREPWITAQTVPSNWVSFEELHVLEYSQNIPLIVTKATGGSKMGDDKTTNVRAHCFYRGRFPIMIVDVAELTPDREEARFDPSIWGSYTNAGISYAARKLFASEMSGDAHNMFSNQPSRSCV